MASLLIVICAAIVSLFAYALAPDSTSNANQMHLSIHSQKPGFSVKMLLLPLPEAEQPPMLQNFFLGKKPTNKEIPINGFELNSDELVYYPYQPNGVLGTPIVVDLNDYANIDLNNLVIDKRFILGTDTFGRDLLSRVIIGTRLSFSIGLVAVLISLLIGVFMGSLAGYFGGKTDAIISWIINVTWSIPTLLLVIAITLALGKGYWQVFIAVGLTMWVEVARVVRGQIMSVKTLPYITAVKALGLRDFRIISKHILPNIMAPVIVIASANFASAILIESGLSFLGIGAQPPSASWGSMIKDHYNYIALGKPYLAVVPGLCIMTLVMAFMVLGSALRDRLDVRS
jgi:peptide/nickel transport system permease protein